MMKRHYIFFLVLLMIISSSACQKKTDELPKETATEESFVQEAMNEGTDQRLLSFSLSGYSDAGKKNWDLKGDSADILTTDLVLLDNVLGHSYGEDNTITLTADKGNFDKTKSILHLEENVITESDDGARMVTDYLRWDAHKEELDTNAPVHITRENMEALGEGAFGQPDLKQMHLKKNVTVNLKPTTTVTCDGQLQVDAANNIATFNGNVLVVDERGKIWADMIKVYFDSEEQAITKVVAQGNVKIKRGDNVTFSEKATYTADSELIVLTGQPKLIMYSEEDLDALTGD